MATRIGIRFDVRDYRRWKSAVKKVAKKALNEAQDLPKRCATDFSDLVFRNIVGQRLGGYQQYSERYGKWKANVRPGTGYWILANEVLGALTTFKVSASSVGGKRTYAWMGGIPNTVRSAGGKSWFGEGDRSSKSVAVAQYAKMMEYGGDFGRAGKHPKRPVFVPATDEYSRKQWDRQFMKSRSKIKKGWA